MYEFYKFIFVANAGSAVAVPGRWRHAVAFICMLVGVLVSARQHGTTLTSALLEPSLARMIRTRRTLCITLLCAIAGGCRSGRAPKLGMPDSTFVGALSELRRVQSDTSLDVTMKDSSRRMVLRRYKVTSAQLELAARVLAESPARASDLWRQIESAPRPTIVKPKASLPGPPAGNNNHPVPRS
jgi:hypothetical protein